jgi:hypothetical protein
MAGGDEFECPDCGSPFPLGTARCPGCGVELEWDDTDGLEAEEVMHEPLELVDPRLPPREGNPPATDRVFSRLGLLGAALTVAAFIGTTVLLNWDTWVRGEAEASVGDTQRLLIYAGAVATTVFALLTIYDLLRGGPTPQDALEQGV